MAAYAASKFKSSAETASNEEPDTANAVLSDLKVGADECILLLEKHKWTCLSTLASVESLWLPSMDHILMVI